MTMEAECAEKIEELHLSLRSYNALKRAGIDCAEQIRAMTVWDILSIRGIGVRSLAEITEKVWGKRDGNHEYPTSATVPDEKETPQ